MDPIRWREIERNLKEVLRTPEPQRESTLQRLYAQDAELAREVESLIACEHSYDWEDPAPAILEHELPTSVEIGDQVGKYTIVEVLGRGGMGVVYLANQSQPQRLIALKVIATELAGEESFRRFKSEVDILARLSHPGIAQIFDAGELEGETFRPYFAMEYVAGETLGDYNSSHSPSIKARVELLIKICHAVQHAHMRGVLHRDLKPSNIVVDASGEPKLLDFGVAKTIAGADSSAERTQAGHLIGTLNYMSPEQAAADPAALDVRTDLYALGVIAYELLSGRLPFDFQGVPLHKAIETIVNVDPEPLDCTNRELRGDLSVVIQKAVSRDIEQRYQSAQELADDLGRVLSGEPVAARRATTVYQLRKLAWHYRGALALLLVAAVGGVAATVGFVLRSMEVSRKNELIEFFLFDRQPGLRERMLLEEGMFDDVIADIDRLLPDQPAIRIKQYERFARVCLDRSQFTRALDLIGRAQRLSSSTLGGSRVRPCSSSGFGATS